MNTYETEEQQVEAIKKWWRDNGMSVTLGVVLGLGAVFGWRGWVNYQDRQAEHAASLYEELNAAVTATEIKQAEMAAERISLDYGATSYKALAALSLAKARYQAQDTAGAEQQLRLALEHAPADAIKQLAALRLARLLLSDGRIEQATQALDENPPAQAFAAEYAALRGDLAVAGGQPETARARYLEAIAQRASNSQLLQQKLDNLSSADKEG